MRHRNVILRVKQDSLIQFPFVRWTAVATWRWVANDDNCGICRMPFDGCCPDCKLPGDDCPLGEWISWYSFNKLTVS